MIPVSYWFFKDQRTQSLSRYLVVISNTSARSPKNYFSEFFTKSHQASYKSSKHSKFYFCNHHFRPRLSFPGSLPTIFLPAGDCNAKNQIRKRFAYLLKTLSNCFSSGQNRLRLAPTVNPLRAAPRGINQNRRARFLRSFRCAPGLRFAPGLTAASRSQTRR